jgi:hypothetical protein
MRSGGNVSGAYGASMNGNGTGPWLRGWPGASASITANGCVSQLDACRAATARVRYLRFTCGPIRSRSIVRVYADKFIVRARAGHRGLDRRSAPRPLRRMYTSAGSR